MLTEVTGEHDQDILTDDSDSASYSTFPSSIGNNAPTISMLKVQMEVLQQHINSLQESQDSKLPELEIKVKKLEEEHSLTNNNLIKLQNNQVSFLHDIQLKNDQSIEDAISRLARLETDVALMKDYLIEIDANQENLGVKVDKVKHTTDNLESLRAMLNHLHMNVTQREELTQKFNQLVEELTTFKCFLSPLLGQEMEMNPENTHHILIYV